MSEAIAEGATVGLVGLGRMGRPMAERLARAGYAVQAYDSSDAAADGLVGVPGCSRAGSPAAAARGAAVVLLMLPDSDAVEEVVLAGGLLTAMEPHSILLDMGSSDPRRTQALAGEAAGAGVTLVDAPVSGGVSGAVNGTLTIMVGGPDEAFSRLRPLLSTMGSRVLHCGPVGAGDAVKALNNLLSATHLLVTSEAMETARRFGLDLSVVLDVINTSSGRSGSTENKWPNFVLPGTFDSGFGLRLMVKDMRTALGLAEALDAPSGLSRRAVELWTAAAADLEPGADHTEIARWLHARGVSASEGAACR